MKGLNKNYDRARVGWKKRLDLVEELKINASCYLPIGYLYREGEIN